MLALQQQQHVEGLCRTHMQTLYDTKPCSMLQLSCQILLQAARYV